jgi:hypothetical protein
MIKSVKKKGRVGHLPDNTVAEIAWRKDGI